MTSLTRLQNWYHSQCDGDWEHQFGVHVETLDNPGWTVKIDLKDTEHEDREFAQIKVQRSEDDWLHISRTPDTFRIACGPSNLEESLSIFCDWAGVTAVE
jgi:hypothetical protein